MASAKEKEWLELYLETGNDKAATREIFDCAEKSVAARSAQLKNRLAVDIDKRLRETMRVNSVVMHKLLVNLADNAQSEQVKAKVAMDLLDRGGYKPVDKHEDLTEHQPIGDMKEEASRLRERLVQGLSKEELTKALQDMETSH